MLFQIRTNAEILNQIITLLLKVSNCTYINQFILSFSNARFTNMTSVPAKLLVWVTPAGFEKFIAEVGKAVNGQITSAPPLSPEDLDKILTTAPKYGIEIIPPPPGQ
jgi:F0F1-type ATP synthase delta subunit